MHFVGAADAAGLGHLRRGTIRIASFHRAVRQRHSLQCVLSIDQSLVIPQLRARDELVLHLTEGLVQSEGNLSAASVAVFILLLLVAVDRIVSGSA